MSEMAYLFDLNLQLIADAVLMIVASLALVFTGVGFIGASEATGLLSGGLGFMGIIGIIIAFAIFILVIGYMLDVIKIAINREDAAPEIDPQRQIINGLKLIALAIIYMIIPVIVMVILSLVNETLGLIVGMILLIIFAILLVIAQCRLAKTESLGEALNIGEVINDLKEIGIVKFIAILIIISIIAYVLSAIATGIGNFSEIIGAILSGIVTIYTTFLQSRAYGLLYSDAE